MIAVGPYASAPAVERTVHGEREPCGEPLETGAQTLAIAGFDEQVHMIPLHGVMDDAEVGLLRTTERATERREHMVGAKERDVASSSQRDVERVRPGV